MKKIRNQGEPVSRSQEEPGEARKSQEELGGARSSQGEEPGRSQEEPGGARSSQEQPEKTVTANGVALLPSTLPGDQALGPIAK